MVTGFLSKLAVVTVAAVGLYIPTIGLSIPLGSCLRTVGVASATPSPTCGGDERECLRASAKSGLSGVRYVSPEDVARCVEAFNACIHGTLNGGNPIPPTSTSPGGRGTNTLPRRFGINYEALVVDCRVSGAAVTCTSNRQEQLPNGTGTYSETGEVTATLSGLTMTGTLKRHGTSEGGCVSEQELSGPVTYVFSLDGTVAMREGPLQQEIVFSGDCANSPPISSTGPVWEGTGTWSAIE
jgi:hypothetical protein